MTNVGKYPPPKDSHGDPYPRHPFYIDVPDCILTDVYGEAIAGAPYVGQVFSIRCGGTTIIRGEGHGAGHIAGFFEEGPPSPHDVYIEIQGSFTDDCAVWLASGNPSRRITIRVVGDIVGNGPLVKFDKNLWLGQYEIL